MQESLLDLVTVVDALSKSFPHLALVVDGDILRGVGGRESLDRMEREKVKTKR
jgi:hypothetical protein